MIIVCDLDRTLIPNGNEDYDNSLADFYERISGSENSVLAYATGRTLDLFYEAEKEYDIKKPDFLLASVGTEVYYNDGNDLVIDPDWAGYVKRRHPNWNRQDIINDLEKMLKDKLLSFYLQENSLQNDNKISYYLEDLDLKKEILAVIKSYIFDNDIRAEVVYSFDPHKGVGLIDILPKNATKLGAIEFLLEKLGKSIDDVVYCGDSGNDLLPITAGIKTVLVKNAPADVREEAMRIAETEGFPDRLYIAKGTKSLNGNYSSGVIEGLEHFGVI